jgi:hypothetical protein
MVGPVEPPQIVSTSSKGAIDSVLFSSFTAPKHLRQKSSLNTTRSAKPISDLRSRSTSNLKNPQFINSSQDYIKFLNDSQDLMNTFPQEYL